MPTEAYDRFTQSTRDAIQEAKKSVLKYKYSYITPEHILLGLIAMADPVVLRAMGAGKATPQQVKILLEHHLRPGDYELTEDQLAFSERAKRVIEAAREEAVRVQRLQIAPEHILLGLTRVRNTVAGAVLAAVDLRTETLRKALKQG
jgi:ATP-dependent Clp protease ATP-binding subunit ClpC